jgi:hypothetical protein
VTYALNAAKTALFYTITSGKNGTDGFPMAWTLSGSNDNMAWTALDARTAQTFVPSQARAYKIKTAGSYAYYKLDVSQSSTSNTTLAEIELIAAP